MSRRTLQLTIQAPPSGVPTWAQQPINQWVDLGTATRVGSVMEYGSDIGLFSYSGGALHPDTLQYYLLGGGHGDYSGNEIYKLDLASETPSWSLVQASTPPAQRVFDASNSPKAYNPDGKPLSRHTWSGTIQVMPHWGAAGRVLLVGCNSPSGYGGGGYPTQDAWDIATGQWTWIDPAFVASNPIGPNPTITPWPTTGTRTGATKDSRNNVWAISKSTAGADIGPARMYNSTTNAMGATSGYTGSWGGRTLVYDSKRDRIVMFPVEFRSSGLCYRAYFDALNGANFREDVWAQNGVTTSTTPTVAASTYIYEPNLDRYIQLVGNTPDALTWTAYRWHSVHPETWEVTDITSQFTGAVPDFTGGASRGRAQPHSRLCYIPQYKGVIFGNAVAKNWAFVRLS